MLPQTCKLNSSVCTRWMEYLNSNVEILLIQVLFFSALIIFKTIGERNFFFFFFGLLYFIFFMTEMFKKIYMGQLCGQENPCLCFFKHFFLSLFGSLVCVVSLTVSQKSLSLTKRGMCKNSYTKTNLL